MSTTTRVLFVDGHEGVRLALARRLERSASVGAIAVAATLAAAVPLAGEMLPDVIVCDPKTLAPEAAEAVRALSATGIPVVVLTSTLRDGEAEAFVDAGAAGLLLKGSSIADLLAATEAAGARRGAYARPAALGQRPS